MAAAEVKAEADVPAVTSHFWFDEEVTPDFAVKMRLESIDFQAKSDFQDVKIIKTTQFGKTLVLDGKTQSASNDEHIYHESLVHPAMLLHPCPRTVYIGGGGEMATAREILRHKSVEKVVMVDSKYAYRSICAQLSPIARTC